eukprot:14302697-Ditylum_brightwellii.AAC.1
MALVTHHLRKGKVAIIDHPRYQPAVIAQMGKYATVVSRCMEIAKHDKETKIFMKIRGKYIMHSTLKKSGHPAAKYHSNK